MVIHRITIEEVEVALNTFRESKVQVLDITVNDELQDYLYHAIRNSNESADIAKAAFLVGIQFGVIVAENRTAAKEIADLEKLSEK